MRKVLVTFLGLVGFAALIYGAFRAWTPLGFLLAGVLLVALAATLEES